MAKLNRRTLFLRVEKILIKEEPEHKSLDDKEVTKLVVARYEKLADDVLEELTTLARECNDSNNSDAEVNKVVELFRKRRAKTAKVKESSKPDPDPPKAKSKEPEKKREEVNKKEQDKKIEEIEEKVRIEDEKVRQKAEKLKSETDRLRLALSKQKEDEDRLKHAASAKQDEGRALKEALKAKYDLPVKVKSTLKDDLPVKVKTTVKDEDKSNNKSTSSNTTEEKDKIKENKDKNNEKDQKKESKDKNDEKPIKPIKSDEKTRQENTNKTKEDETRSKQKEKDREKIDEANQKDDEKKRQEEIERQNKLEKENEELKRLVRAKEEETERLRKEMEKKLVQEKKELEKQIEQKIIQEKLLAEERLKKDLEETKNLLKKLTLENSSLKSHNTELLKKKRQYEDLNSNLRNEKMKLEDQSLKVEEKLKVSEAEKALAEQKLSTIPLLTGKSQSVNLTRVIGVKHVIVDTSILIGRLFEFKFAVKNTSHVFVIPMQVTKELDNLKERKNSPQSQPARDAIRYLATQGRDKMRGQSVTEVMSPSALSEVAPHSPDERILLCALYYQTYVADDVVLISDDNNMRARGSLHYGLDVMSGLEFTGDVMKKANFSFSSSSDSVPRPRPVESHVRRVVPVSSSADSVPAPKPKSFDANAKPKPSDGNNTAVRPRELDNKPRTAHRTSPQDKSELSKVGYASRHRMPDRKKLLENNLNATWVAPVPNLTLPVVVSGPRSTMFDTQCK